MRIWWMHVAGCTVGHLLLEAEFPDVFSRAARAARKEGSGYETI